MAKAKCISAAITVEIRVILQKGRVCVVWLLVFILNSDVTPLKRVPLRVFVNKVFYAPRDAVMKPTPAILLF